MAFRVLSIDGGGMRGIYTSTYLESLEKAFSERRQYPQGLDIGKAFQLIVGTSTGAIIGCGLAKGVRPTEMVQLYREHGPKIFPKKMPSGFSWDLIDQMCKRSKYLKKGDEALRQALTEVFQGTTVRQIWEERRIALAVPAVNMSTYRAWVFKTPHDTKSNHRDDNYTLANICLASSAAPLFRSLAAIDHTTDGGCDIFADGGLWANNPVIVALVESLRILGDREEEIEIYSLGSCGKPEGEVIQKDEAHRGLLEWKFGGGAANVSIAAQEFAFDMVAKLLLPHLKRTVRIVRFPAEKIPGDLLQYLDLDETRGKGLEALMRQARHDADMTNSGIQQGTAEGKMIEALFNDMPPLTT
ncbi:CBASS cGAMP-activated phospholipase [Methylotuvimicrobium sp.]|uniref:CBASS cGAMP-activated phospholipase n=1 Tax=Methylotuvimicrobium sp. TaxID=2822413 RepID=UPI003D65E851